MRFFERPYFRGEKNLGGLRCFILLLRKLKSFNLFSENKLSYNEKVNRQNAYIKRINGIIRIFKNLVRNKVRKFFFISKYKIISNQKEKIKVLENLNLSSLYTKSEIRDP